VSVTRHREFAERVQNQGELGLLDELLADDMVDHTPPTGRRATIRVMDFVRYRDGQVVDHWNIVDIAGLMAQLNA
jgi:predicted ester cyclase